MLTEETNRLVVPVVMTLAGHDPVGGAGVQADMEAIISQGCHPVSVITCLTVQDTRNVQRIDPVADYLIEQQAEAILADMPVAAFKIGLLGSVAVVEAVHRILLQAPDVPVILDPVLAAGGGQSLSSDLLLEAIREYLLPLTTLLTPNVPEAASLALAGETQDDYAFSLLDQGCEYVLLTGTHAATERVENALYADGKRQRTWLWERLPQTYHGSGCTLASACAANLAKGMDVSKAVAAAQAYTWGSLQAGRRLGRGQWIPDRFYWRQG
ncbi:MAG TPA: hydroxymethylpyrimidine/phosphomethylpyrimidine kinase [Candidatus Thiothrix moscowensis]|uniref:bifunctional hydroxymethylpyrimidine kinase/phosphomethylpyrimidine kinase n=1 Tax=unclassified Thiothrix TaxID=2636184 RepID=UPI0025EBA3EF|nr:MULTISPECIES: hydroxymethylpyrimidine/phosphomethylpyrimidine kinase [unclassified Thiothrix]HRJ54013.1 hydroxymethylpyrimidine/phosphomethylpyrimidine kinase [Candidatus Thiothrix moscowensis]HRJ94095.1 hydroxymethylpyrimidine/phosphomethylpyrimidine kinase [Candidatus Thiothrix moscowensis]